MEVEFGIQYTKLLAFFVWGDVIFFSISKCVVRFCFRGDDGKRISSKTTPEVKQFVPEKCWERETFGFPFWVNPDYFQGSNCY